MGVSTSKKNRHAPAGKPPPVPAAINMPPQPPYNGHPIQYHHVNIQASINMQAHLSFTAPGASFTCTNVEQYYPTLAAMYDQGYKMLVFVSLPGSTKTGGGFSMQTTSQVKFQGIFRHLFPEEMQQKWELRVEKSTLMNQMFYSWAGNMILSSSRQSGSTSDSSHIIQTINNISQMGGRLISVEMTGMAGQQLEYQQKMAQSMHRYYPGSGTPMPVCQVAVDVFYEVPSNPTGETYVYQIVNCPLTSTLMSGMRPTFQSSIDWQNVMTQYMGTGWKLVEIFEDYSAVMASQGGFSINCTQTKNCLWIFEKPASRINDNTPLYEGTMVEHWFRTNTNMKGLGFGGVEVTVQTDWEPVLEHYGKTGWQAVRILETPDMQFEGAFSTSYKTRQLIFLQRLKEGVLEFTGAAAPSMAAPPIGLAPLPPDQQAPPQYNQLYGEKGENQ